MLMLDFDQATGIEVKHKSGCSQAAVEHKYEIRYINNWLYDKYTQFQLYNGCGRQALLNIQILQVKLKGTAQNCCPADQSIIW